MKNNQRVTITKRLLQEALLHLLDTKPLDKISITELCNEAGINRTTFYRHYELPRDVLLEMEGNLVHEIRTKFSTPHTLAEAEKYVESILTYLYNHSDLLKILISCKSDDVLTYILSEFDKIFLELKSEIQEMSDIDHDSAKLLSAFCVGGAYHLLRQWLFEDIDKTPKEITQLIMRFMDKEIIL